MYQRDFETKITPAAPAVRVPIGLTSAFVMRNPGIFRKNRTDSLCSQNLCHICRDFFRVAVERCSSRKLGKRPSFMGFELFKSRWSKTSVKQRSAFASGFPWNGQKISRWLSDYAQTRVAAVHSIFRFPTISCNSVKNSMLSLQKETDWFSLLQTNIPFTCPDPMTMTNDSRKISQEINPNGDCALHCKNPFYSSTQQRHLHVYIAVMVVLSFIFNGSAFVRWRFLSMCLQRIESCFCFRFC